MSEKIEVVGTHLRWRGIRFRILAWRQRDPNIKVITKNKDNQEYKFTIQETEDGGYILKRVDSPQKEKKPLLEEPSFEI
jgi:hypothetical protein